MNNSVLLPIMIFFLLVISIFYGNSIPGILLVILNFILLLGYYFNRRKFKSIFSPISITYIAVLLSFIIKGIYIIDTEKFELGLLIYPYFYIIIFISAFLISFTLSSDTKLIKQYIKISNRSILPLKRLKKALSMLMLLACFLFITKLGISNIGSVFQNVLGNRILFQNDGGLYTQTIILVLLQSSLYIFIIAIFENYGRFKISLFLIGTIFLNILIPMTLGGRGMIFTPIIMTVFIITTYSKKTNYLFLFLLGIVIILFSGWYGMFRDGIVDSTVGTSDLIKNVLDRYVQLDNLIRLVNSPVDFPFGKSFIDFLYSPFPRSIFPDKPYNFNSQMTQIYLPLQFQNKIVSDFTAIGELLINFKFLGVLFGGFFFGKVIDIFNRFFIYDNSRFFYLWYPFMMLKPMSLLYGGLINSTVNMMILLETPIIICIWLLISKKSRVENEELSVYHS
ncbi:hypothetical protein BAU18_002183 [Enterococcus diestrammenae]|uniref:Oligosaccharide repeat unit polymerase n=1 Tax=Enterococcus diestrammenae TaxID=1155073 RepID=A0ABV0F7H8_9ENTE|nr:O-antigen polymerase [Enterococcus diestrammenae]